MRLRLARPLGLGAAAAALAFVGWGGLGACSSFGDEPDSGAPVDGGPVLDGATSGDAPVGDGPAGNTDASDGGPERCGSCEGPCLPGVKACAPYVPFTGVPAGDITGLAIRSDDLYIAVQGMQSGIARAPVPKDTKVSPFGFVAMVDSPVGLAVSDAALFTTALGPGPARVVARLPIGSPAAELSVLPATLVAASSSHIIAGGPTALHACPLSDLFGGCVTDTNAVTVTHAAIAGTHGCFIGSLSGSETRVHCRDGVALPGVRAPVGSATALAVGPDRVAWAEGDFIRTEKLSGPSALAEFQLSPVSGAITALAIDGVDLFYVRGNDLFRCALADCRIANRVRLTTAPNIRFLALTDRHVYFVIGANGALQVARVPRTP
ncbi:MAG: hypothetical protein JST00_35480 [Deltaproteobacteria bacterium]|nr:hypothetical protein [Deltaproteobacteria bacterium]